MPPITKYTSTEERYDALLQQKGKKLVVYHTNWANYSKDYQVKDIPIDKVNDVCYAFFNLKADGQVFSGDTWADFEKKYTDKARGVEPVDTWDSESPFYGNLGQFYKLKKSGKNFNLILSVGGWSWSKYFSSAVSPKNRENFIKSLLVIFDKYPIFSGVS